MDTPKIKKNRSLQSSYDGWDNSSYKHFRVNGASPDERPSNGKSRAKKSYECKRSPDKTHYYDEITVGYVTSYRERMNVSCSYCGKYSHSFYVNIGPLPEWLQRLQNKFGFDW